MMRISYEHEGGWHCGKSNLLVNVNQWRGGHATMYVWWTLHKTTAWVSATREESARRTLNEMTTASETMSRYDGRRSNNIMTAAGGCVNKDDESVRQVSDEWNSTAARVCATRDDVTRGAHPTMRIYQRFPFAAVPVRYNKRSRLLAAAR